MTVLVCISVNLEPVFSADLETAEGEAFREEFILAEPFLLKIGRRHSGGRVEAIHIQTKVSSSIDFDRELIFARLQDCGNLKNSKSIVHGVVLKETIGEKAIFQVQLYQIKLDIYREASSVVFEYYSDCVLGTGS